MGTCTVHKHPSGEVRAEAQRRPWLEYRAKQGIAGFVSPSKKIRICSRTQKKKTSLAFFIGLVGAVRKITLGRKQKLTEKDEQNGS